MIRKLLRVVLFAITSTSILAAEPPLLAPPPAPPSAIVQQAQEKVNAGQFREAVQFISQQLSDRTAADWDEDRFMLLELKGECLLQLKQRVAAADSFNAPFRIATSAEMAAWPRANEVLLRSSPATVAASAAVTQPADILDGDSRKAAFLSSRDEKLRIAQPMIEKALAGKTLPPMLELLPTLFDMAYLEQAATGSCMQTRAILKNMGQRARDLMQPEIRRVAHRINVMEDVSNSLVEVNGAWGEGAQRRGLDSTQRKELRDNIDYLHQIERAARDARKRAQWMGSEGTAWEPIIADAVDLADRATALADLGK